MTDTHVPPPPPPAAPEERDTAKIEQLKRTSWGLFIASVLFWIFAWAANSLLITLVSNALFLAALIVVAMYYSHIRKLGYLSIVVGILGILMCFGGQWISGILFLLFGVTCAVIDAVQKRRFVILGVAAAIFVLPLLIIASIFLTATSSIKRAATRPADTGAVASYDHEMVEEEEPPRVILPTKAELEEAEEARRLQEWRASPEGQEVLRRQAEEAERSRAERVARQERLREEARKNTIYRVAPGNPPIYHRDGCPAADSERLPLVSLAIARMQKAQPHTCVRDPGGE